MKNFIEQISIKNSEIFTNQVKFGSNRAAHQKIGGNSYIGQYSKCQISADSIGGPMAHWSVSNSCGPQEKNKIDKTQLCKKRMKSIKRK